MRSNRPYVQLEPKILDDYGERLEASQAALQVGRRLYQREDHGAHPGEFLCRKIFPVCRAAKTNPGVPPERNSEWSKENRRAAGAVSALLLQARYSSKKQKTELCKASLSFEG